MGSSQQGVDLLIEKLVIDSARLPAHSTDKTNSFHAPSLYDRRKLLRKNEGQTVFVGLKPIGSHPDENSDRWDQNSAFPRGPCCGQVQPKASLPFQSPVQ